MEHSRRTRLASSLEKFIFVDQCTSTTRSSGMSRLEVCQVFSTSLQVLITNISGFQFLFAWTKYCPFGKRKLKS